MLVPALLFFAANREGEAVHGWAIPMATDTAFAIGILALLGQRAPKGLTAFLLALAIIYHLGRCCSSRFFSTDAIDMHYL
jgi:NhaA family Na+:H+ antiporter